MSSRVSVALVVATLAIALPSAAGAERDRLVLKHAEAPTLAGYSAVPSPAAGDDLA